MRCHDAIRCTLRFAHRYFQRTLEQAAQRKTPGPVKISVKRDRSGVGRVGWLSPDRSSLHVPRPIECMCWRTIFDQRGAQGCGASPTKLRYSYGTCPSCQWNFLIPRGGVIFFRDGVFDTPIPEARIVALPVHHHSPFSCFPLLILSPCQVRFPGKTHRPCLVPI